MAGLCLHATLLVGACAGDEPDETTDTIDQTEADADRADALGETGGRGPTGQIDEFPPEPTLVAARLGVEGDELVLTLENLTDVGGTASLSALVENPAALFMTQDAGTVAFGPRETIEVLLSADDIDGLDLLGQEWTDARVSFEFQLDDGRRGGAPVSVFVEDGLVAPPRQVVASGVTRGFPELDVPDRARSLGGATFQMCFANVVTHSGAFEGNLDFHRGTGQFVFAAGMRVDPTQPDGTALPTRFLDSQGCTTFPRLTGTWSFLMALQGRDFPVAGVTMIARTTAGTLPGRTVTQVVGSTGDPARLPFTMAAGEHAQLQTAFSAVLHTTLRATSLGAAVRASALNIQMGTATNYTHSTRTIQVTPTSAIARFSVSHETGHWIHLNWESMGTDYSYCAAGDGGCTPPADDDCTRTPDNTHGMLTVEWNSVAHVEGIATFFSGVAFNNAFGGADCFLPDTGNLSCETEGKTLETGETGDGPCFEWFDDMFFSTSVEHDWTKMYWDFLADEGQNFVTYLGNERARSGWTRANHSSKVFEGLSQAMNAALRRAAIGNIQEGAAH